MCIHNTGGKLAEMSIKLFRRPPLSISSSIRNHNHLITSHARSDSLHFRLFLPSDPPRPHNSHKFLPFSPGLTLGENKPSLSLSSSYYFPIPKQDGERPETLHRRGRIGGGEVPRGIRSGGVGLCAHSRGSCTSIPPPRCSDPTWDESVSRRQVWRGG